MTGTQPSQDLVRLARQALDLLAERVQFPHSDPLAHRRTKVG